MTIFSRLRLFEFVMMLGMLGISAQLLLWPSTISESALRYMLVLFSEQLLTIMFLVSGLFRLAALIANGSWRVWGPRLRSYSSVLGWVQWTTVTVALVRLHIETGAAPSIGISIYAALSVGEMISLYWVIQDGARPR